MAGVASGLDTGGKKIVKGVKYLTQAGKALGQGVVGLANATLTENPQNAENNFDLLIVESSSPSFGSSVAFAALPSL